VEAVAVPEVPLGAGAHGRLSAGAAGAQVFNEANLEFMEKIIERSGLGDETGLSDGIQAMREPGAPMKTTLKQATDETEMVIFDVAGNAMRQAGVRPEEARARDRLSRCCQAAAAWSSAVAAAVETAG